MITGTILQLLGWIATGMLSLLPHVDVPSWLSDDGSVGKVFQAAGSMGAWFPVGLVTTVLVAVLTIWSVAFGIKLVREVISVLTGGGGSAA